MTKHKQTIHKTIFTIRGSTVSGMTTKVPARRGGGCKLEKMKKCASGRPYDDPVAAAAPAAPAARFVPEADFVDPEKKLPCYHF